MDILLPTDFMPFDKSHYGISIFSGKHTSDVLHSALWPINISPQENSGLVKYLNSKYRISSTNMMLLDILALSVIYRYIGAVCNI
jgi:hypothetical protein